MQEDGQQVSIIVNPQGVILDGHTRFNICEELNLEPKYTIKKFPTLQKEKEFVVSVNINRRQFTLFERGEALFSWWKEEKRKSQSEGGYATHATRRTGISHGGTVTGKKERLLNRFGKIIGCSATTAHELTWLMIHATKDIKVKLRTEDITVNTAYLQLAQPVRKPRSAYGIYQIHPKCLNCGSHTTPIQDTSCHVHSQVCCSKCGWGN